ncbi:MAG: hypothetical protein KBA30_00930 [Clostridia bacterium]|nr:hypothetical protein [Clostridia bacterium]
MEFVVDYILPPAAIPFGYLASRLITASLLFILPFTRRLASRGAHREPARTRRLVVAACAGWTAALLAAATAALWTGHPEIAVFLLLGILGGVFWKNAGRDVNRENLRRYVRWNRRYLEPDGWIGYIAECTGDPEWVRYAGRLVGRPVDVEFADRLMREAARRDADQRGEHAVPGEPDILPVAKGLTWTRSLEETRELGSDFKPRI